MIWIAILENIKYSGNFSEDEDGMMKYLQSFCDNIELSNNGYVCVVDNSGKLIAYPDYDPDYFESLGDVSVSDIQGENVKTFKDINTNEIFSGLANYADADYSDIIVSMLVGELGKRVQVHQ